MNEVERVIIKGVKKNTETVFFDSMEYLGSVIPMVRLTESNVVEESLPLKSKSIDVVIPLSMSYG